MVIELGQNEHIVKTVRRHWFVLFAKSLGLLFVFILPFIIFYIIYDKIELLGFGGFSFSFNLPLILFFASGWLLVIMLRFFYYWTDHYLDGLVITNKRIVDIEQKGFFSRQTSSFYIDHIQDVTTDTHGIIATLLDFGDIHIQTAGEFQKFILKTAPNPKKVRKIILAQHDKIISRKSQNPSTNT